MKLIHADCLEAMRGMPADSVDAIVTDPPYGWRFMGKAWDGADIVAKQNRNYSKRTFIEQDGKVRERTNISTPLSQVAGEYDLSPTGNKAFQVFTEEWAREALRVLKPGGHALIFCGPRTYHRMACGVEDAGFEVRDQFQWIFGSGFPKSLNISKAIDKAAGAEREVIGPSQHHCPGRKSDGTKNSLRQLYRAEDGGDGKYITTPTTPSAKQWDGWGTALKPANEPILLARKPLSEKTVAANVMRWGTGGINVDGCRIEGVPRTTHAAGNVVTCVAASGHMKGKAPHGPMPAPAGRFPSNLLLDETAAQMLDEQSGISKSQGGSRGKSGVGYGMQAQDVKPGLGDTGGASRFFYVAKASAREKQAGLTRREPEKVNDGRDAPIDNPFQRGETLRKNTHPTIKPIRLMRYLCRLITPPNGIVLDPFMGSGSTGIAALQEQFNFIGIEREAEYMAIAEARLLNAQEETKGESPCPMKCRT